MIQSENLSAISFNQRKMRKYKRKDPQIYSYQTAQTFYIEEEKKDTFHDEEHE